MSLTPALPVDGNGRTPHSGVTPGVGYAVPQLGTQTTDSVTGQAVAPSIVSIANSGIPSSAPVVVQKTNAVSTGSVASLAKAFTSTNTAGNSIIVVCGCGNGTAMTVADSLGNTYTQAVNAPNSTTFEVAIFYAVNVLAGANTVTVTNAGTAASMALEIYEVSGLITQVTAQPDQSSSSTATAASASTSALAASSPNSLIFAGVAIGTGVVTAVTPGTGFTNDGGVLQPATAAGLFQFIAMSGYLASTNPITPTLSWTTSRANAMAAAIFKPVVVGVAGTVTIGGYNYTRVTTAATTLVKTGPGILHAIVVNKPTSTATIEADDALTNTSPVIGILGAFAASIAPFGVVYDVAFTTGLSVTVGTATVDATIVWK